MKRFAPDNRRHRFGLFLAGVVFAVALGGGMCAGQGEPPLKSLNDLHGRKIGVMLGSVQDLYVTRHFPDSEVVRFNSPADSINALKSGQIDVNITDALAASVILPKNPDLAIMVRAIQTEKIGIAFSKDNPRLREEFNAFLAEIRKSGLYQEIHRRWIENPEKATVPTLPPPGQNGTLTVGTSNVGLPFVAVKNGEFSGFDVELMERFARRLNKVLVIKDMQFAGLIAALASGKVDLVASCLTITEERKKQVDFSDFYFESETVAMARAKELAGAKSAAPERQSSILSGIQESFYNNIIEEQRYLLILDGLWTTIVISVFSLIFGTLLGVGVCYCRMSRNRVLSYSARFFIAVLRGTPVLVLLMVVFYIVFASVDVDPILAAVLTFGLNFAAYVSEMFRMAIDSVDPGQVEAGVALGFTRFKAFLYIVLPQAARRVLPVYKGEFISMVKMTSVVGYIAVQDLTKAGDIIRSRTFEAFFPLLMVAVLYFAVVFALTLTLTVVERRLDRKARRKKTRKTA